MSFKTDEYGLIGFPLTHSFSQRYFNEKFKSEKIDAVYLNFQLSDIGELMEMLSEHPRLQGFNVTLPYKEHIIPYLDEIDPKAKEIGAVNVVKIQHLPGGDIRLKGFNSDYIGFRDSIVPLLKEGPHSALVLGTGGASKAVKVALKSIGVNISMVSRNMKPGVDYTYEMLTEEVMKSHDIIVNTTPVGMYPHSEECPPIPYEYITPDHILYDLIYNPDVTTFMKLGADQGATTKNGLEMLLLQAFESWNIWKSK
ncbi:MAG: shikimate dehydrogenase [Muribaculaceae bacterium]|jgi:Shikimate 5-dehydrogenase|nr:shikimate dehydrogenase [Muribaculaceae bacterium]